MGWFTWQALQIHNRHTQAVAVIPTDGTFDFAQWIGRIPLTVGHRQIFAVHFSLRDHGDQSVHGFSAACHHHQAAGVFVQTVHDAGSGQHDRLRIKCQQTVQQCATPVTWSGMHNQACRFIEHPKVCVFVDNFERHLFWFECLALGRGSQNNLVMLASTHLDGRLVDQPCFRQYTVHTTFCQKLLRVAARKLRQQLRQCTV